MYMAPEKRLYSQHELDYQTFIFLPVNTFITIYSIKRNQFLLYIQMERYRNIDEQIDG